MDGTEHRVDDLTGSEVVLVAGRQDRPNLPAGTCPFCPGGLEAPEPYTVRSFPNRWPALPGGRSEIVLYSPDHGASFASLEVAGAREVVDLWAERTAALAERADVAYVLVFENRGAAVGATIPHPHGQIYAFDRVPPAPAAELAAATCTLCRSEPAGRLVRTVADWRAVVPAASAWPYGLLLAPTAHHTDLPSLDGAGREALAGLLVDVLGRLDRLFAEPMPYMLWVHQHPVDGGTWPAAHLHVHVAPFLRAPGTPRFVAAGELGSGMFFNPVPPEEAAAALRRA